MSNIVVYISDGLCCFPDSNLNFGFCEVLVPVTGVVELDELGELDELLFFLLSKYFFPAYIPAAPNANPAISFLWSLANLYACPVFFLL